MSNVENTAPEAEKPKRGRDKRGPREERASEKSPYIERVVFIKPCSKGCFRWSPFLLHRTRSAW